MATDIKNENNASAAAEESKIIEPKQCPRGKLHCHNWLEDIPGGLADFDIVEVQFKNTRKGYYLNNTKSGKKMRRNKL